MTETNNNIRLRNKRHRKGVHKNTLYFKRKVRESERKETVVFVCRCPVTVTVQNDRWLTLSAPLKKERKEKTRHDRKNSFRNKSSRFGKCTCRHGKNGIQTTLEVCVFFLCTGQTHCYPIKGVLNIKLNLKKNNKLFMYTFTIGVCVLCMWVPWSMCAPMMMTTTATMTTAMCGIGARYMSECVRTASFSKLAETLQTHIGTDTLANK